MIAAELRNFLISLWRMFFPAFLCFSFVLASTSYASVGCPFVVVSPPKAGTHLAGKAIGLVTEMPVAYYLCGLGATRDEAVANIEREASAGRFVVGHHFDRFIVQDLLDRGYKVIFTQRDPRDQIISAMHYIRAGHWHWLPNARIADINLQIEDLITGFISGSPWLNYHYLQFEDSILHVPPERIYFCHFEDLVGSAGGGSDERQLSALFELAAFLELQEPMTIERAETVASNIFGGTQTFRSGQIGTWEKYFTKRHRRLFREQYGSLVARLGYEPDGVDYGRNACSFFVVEPQLGTYVNDRALSLITGTTAMFQFGLDWASIEDCMTSIDHEIALGSFVVRNSVNNETVQQLVNRDYKIVWAQRDPRDVIVAAANSLLAGCPLDSPWTFIKNRDLLIEELITGALTGVCYLDAAYATMADSIKGMPADRIYCSRFEDLVGIAGGGSYEKQLLTISNLAKFLELEQPLTPEAIEEIATQLSKEVLNSPDQQIGIWRQYFTGKHRRLFREKYPDLLIQMGYK